MSKNMQNKMKRARLARIITWIVMSTLIIFVVILSIHECNRALTDGTAARAAGTFVKDFKQAMDDE